MTVEESRAGSKARSTWFARSLSLALVIQIPLLIAAGSGHLNQMNPDAVAYLRVARYYLEGCFQLAVNGYWGPLFSWLVAPLLTLVEKPAVAARIVMGLSALIYLAGGTCLLRALGFDRMTVGIGAVLLALFSINLSVAVISPDLLMSGLFLLALHYTLAPGAGRRPLVAGLLYGLAYLAKAVALPMALVLLTAISLIRVYAGGATRHPVMRSVTWGTIGLVLIALPWITVLSWHYGKPTFSTSGSISHAFVGPHNPDLKHPTFVVHHLPEAGRVTSWEDPTALRDHALYQRWSPFASIADFTHQIRLTLYNAYNVLRFLAEFDGIGIGITSAFLGLVLFRPWRRSCETYPWRLAAPATVLMAGIYLPVYADAERYYLGCYPLLLASAFGVVGAFAELAATRFLTTVHATRPAAMRSVATVLVAASFGAALPGRLQQALSHGYVTPSYVLAQRLAPLLPSTEPIVSVGDSGRVALYTAFLTGQPYYGNRLGKDNVSVTDLLKTGAGYVVVKRDLPLAQALSHHAAAQRLGGGLNETTWPVRVYRLEG
ncbi:MAG: hypothetical protein ACREV1_09220 [Gammaproteobacteria bacterium]